MKVVAGKYRIERVLGEGGMGTVLAATHVVLERPVALKVLRTAGDARSTERLLREARAVAALRSDHVVTVTDCGTAEDGAPYLAMELLVGRDLGSHLEDTGPLALDEACACIVHACEGLAEAHGRGIVHRDVKPRNLFRTQRTDGRVLVKVLDFGIAKRTLDAAADARLTREGEAVGSPAYMSPEQLQGAPLDARTDVWSLGTVLYELLTGRLPFEGASLAELRERVRAPLALPLQALRPDVPDAVARVVGGCLEPTKRRRVADVAELAKALAPFASPLYGDVSDAPRRARALLDGAATRSSAPPLDSLDPRPRSQVTASFHPSTREEGPTPSRGRPYGPALGALTVGLLLLAAMSRTATSPARPPPPDPEAASASLPLTAAHAPSSPLAPAVATTRPPVPAVTPLAIAMPRPQPRRPTAPTATTEASAPAPAAPALATNVAPAGLPAVRR